VIWRLNRPVEYFDHTRLVADEIRFTFIVEGGNVQVIAQPSLIWKPKLGPVEQTSDYGKGTHLQVLRVLDAAKADAEQVETTSK